MTTPVSAEELARAHDRSPPPYKAERVRSADGSAE
jgi:hypothetical protein